MIYKNWIKVAKTGTAITLSFCLLTTPVHLADAAAAFQDVKPASDVFALPSHLGYLMDHFDASANPSKRIILIQDLHAHYGAQKNIAGILEFLAKKLEEPQGSAFRVPGFALVTSAAERETRNAKPSLPFALAVEGASGPVDSSIMALFPDAAIKESAADYLMHEGELTGAEYFAVKRGLPHALTGVEDETYYALNRDLFRKSLQDRQKLTDLLWGIQSQVTSLKNKIYSKEIQNIQRKLDAFDHGTIGTNEVIAWLTTETQALGIDASGLRSKESDRLFDTIQSLGFILQIQKARTSTERDLVQLEHDLALLLKVADLQATQQDVQSFAPRLNRFVTLCHALLKSNGLKTFDKEQIRELITTSVDYYALALVRNKPIVENTLALLNNRSGFRVLPAGRQVPGSAVKSLNGPRPETRNAELETVVLVAGGFHTKPITQILKQKNVSYVVLTPQIDEISESQHELYVKRLSGQFLTTDEIIAKAPLYAAEEARLAKRHGRRADSLAIGVFGLGVAAYFLETSLAQQAAANHQTLAQYFSDTFIGLINGYSGTAQTFVQNWQTHMQTYLGLSATGIMTATLFPPPNATIEAELERIRTERGRTLKEALSSLESKLAQLEVKELLEVKEEELKNWVNHEQTKDGQNTKSRLKVVIDLWFNFYATSIFAGLRPETKIYLVRLAFGNYRYNKEIPALDQAELDRAINDLANYFKRSNFSDSEIHRWIRLYEENRLPFITPAFSAFGEWSVRPLFADVSSRTLYRLALMALERSRDPNLSVSNWQPKPLPESRSPVLAKPPVPPARVLSSDEDHIQEILLELKNQYQRDPFALSAHLNFNTNFRVIPTDARKNSLFPHETSRLEIVLSIDASDGTMQVYPTSEDAVDKIPQKIQSAIRTALDIYNQEAQKKRAQLDQEIQHQIRQLDGGKLASALSDLGAYFNMRDVPQSKIEDWIASYRRTADGVAVTMDGDSFVPTVSSWIHQDLFENRSKEVRITLVRMAFTLSQDMPVIKLGVGSKRQDVENEEFEGLIWIRVGLRMYQIELRGDDVVIQPYELDRKTSLGNPQTLSKFKGKKITVGRSPDMHYRDIDNPALSRVHLSFEIDQEGQNPPRLSLYNLQPNNWTWVYLKKPKQTEMTDQGAKSSSPYSIARELLQRIGLISALIITLLTVIPGIASAAAVAGNIVPDPGSPHTIAYLLSGGIIAIGVAAAARLIPRLRAVQPQAPKIRVFLEDQELVPDIDGKIYLTVGSTTLILDVNRKLVYRQWFEKRSLRLEPALHGIFPYVIGRDLSNDLQISDPTVSSHHGTIAVTSSGDIIIRNGYNGKTPRNPIRALRSQIKTSEEASAKRPWHRGWLGKIGTLVMVAALSAIPGAASAAGVKELVSTPPSVVQITEGTSSQWVYITGHWGADHPAQNTSSQFAVELLRSMKRVGDFKGKITGAIESTIQHYVPGPFKAGMPINLDGLTTAAREDFLRSHPTDVIIQLPHITLPSIKVPAGPVVKGLPSVDFSWWDQMMMYFMDHPHTTEIVVGIVLAALVLGTAFLISRIRQRRAQNRRTAAAAAAMKDLRQARELYYQIKDDEKRSSELESARAAYGAAKVRAINVWINTEGKAISAAGKVMGRIYMQALNATAANRENQERWLEQRLHEIIADDHYEFIDALNLVMQIRQQLAQASEKQRPQALIDFYRSYAGLLGKISDGSVIGPDDLLELNYRDLADQGIPLRSTEMGVHDGHVVEVTRVGFQSYRSDEGNIEAQVRLAANEAIVTERPIPAPGIKPLFIPPHDNGSIPKEPAETHLPFVSPEAQTPGNTIYGRSDQIQVDEKTVAMDIGGEFGSAVLEFFSLNMKAAWNQIRSVIEVLFDFVREPSEFKYKIGAMQLLMTKLARRINPNMDIEVGFLPNPRWGQVMLFTPTFNSAGRLIKAQILINANLSLATLLRAAAHELYHIASPRIPHRGIVEYYRYYKEEQRINKLVRAFMADEDNVNVLINVINIVGDTLRDEGHAAAEASISDKLLDELEHALGLGKYRSRELAKDITRQRGFLGMLTAA